MNKRKLLVVLGMHRSGTSALTRGLLVLGVQLGDTLLAAEPMNPKGFWEDRHITEFNEEILAFLSSSWHTVTPIEQSDVALLKKHGFFLRAIELLRGKIDKVDVFAFKDPRVAKLFQFWKEVFEYCQLDVHYVIAIRNPLSVVRSLVKRDGFEEEKCYLLWIDHVLKSLCNTSYEKRVIVEFDQLISSPEREIKRIAEKFKLKIDINELKNYQGFFLDNKLRNEKYSIEDLTLSKTCPPLALDIYNFLYKEARDLGGHDDNYLINQSEVWRDEFERYLILLNLIDKKNEDCELCNIERGKEQQNIQELSGINETITRRLENVIHQKEGVEEKLHLAEEKLHLAEEKLHLTENTVSFLRSEIGEKKSAITNLKTTINTLNEMIWARDAELERIRNRLAETENNVLQLKYRLQEQSLVCNETNNILKSSGFMLLRDLLVRCNLRKLYQYRVYKRLLQDSPFLDTKWYLEQYPHVQVDPIDHYYYYGADEGNNPSPYFSTRWYLGTYPEVVQAGMNPLLHYLRFGEQEGRQPNFYFSPVWYAQEYGLDTTQGALADFIHYGAFAGRNPGPYFDVAWYLEAYPDVRASGFNPLYHYLGYGMQEQRSVNPYFDAGWYLAQYTNADGASQQDDPFLHYLLHGSREKKSPSPHFDLGWYAREYAASLGDEEPLSHFLRSRRLIWRDIQEETFPEQGSLPVIPRCIDPIAEEKTSVDLGDAKKVAVHFFIHTNESVPEVISALQCVPGAFDLYLSVPQDMDPEALVQRMTESIRSLGAIFIQPVPDGLYDLAALIVLHGKALSGYEIIGHFSAGNTLDSGTANGRSRALLGDFFGLATNSTKRVAYLFAMLLADTKIIFPKSDNYFEKNATGWGADYAAAQTITAQYGWPSMQEYDHIDFPSDTLFWARTQCLEPMLRAPLAYQDFDSGVLERVLKRLLLVSTVPFPGKIVRLELDHSTQYCRFYEERGDYSATAGKSEIKVLSYYLPQFHPIPENDAWHGKGFTEWTKVRSANPLFKGHYQQHTPHADIGYYLLDSPAVLKQQAELMRTAGVYGQVFYHYWFSGKMILEAPARMLLDHPDIAMPFCFCWANENWTKAWDGNEDEILLGQEYSAEDARAFIRYLIPFFKDSRYVTVDGRPMLFIYRPASIPDPGEYLTIWKEECRENGVQEPYVVAVLTRGACSPVDFGMDAGVERVLHDWTGGAVKEKKSRLHAYTRLQGSVLSYDEVADWYMEQTKPKRFEYFRSLVTTFDNTPRYGDQAILLHASTPEKFQSWLESSMAYSRKYLPEDRRFVLINAWNEWAEGAHLEPDTLFGYAYLNAVGRALSGFPYSKTGPVKAAEWPESVRIQVHFSDTVLAQLQEDPVLKERFIDTFIRACSYTSCRFHLLHDEMQARLLPENRYEKGVPEYIVMVRRVAFFDSDILKKLIETKAGEPEEVAVVANRYGDDIVFPAVSGIMTVDKGYLYDAPLTIFSASVGPQGIKNTVVCVDACAFVTAPGTVSPEEVVQITTIIRFHRSSRMDELKRALRSLQAMQNCQVLPMIAAQDLSAAQKTALREVLEQGSWYPGTRPRVKYYASAGGAGDLRSKMLNECLQEVSTRYAAFLDYDDLLLPHAYDWLSQRLRKTGKAVAFGRVYQTDFLSKTGQFLQRHKAYQFGHCYDDFLNDNHAPLHSYMIDLERVNLEDVTYHDDQKYMEDYYLLLQIVTRDNADWEGLSQNVYIGDYMRGVDRKHTLALSSEQEVNAVLQDPHYIVCQKRIQELQKKVQKFD
ncbi:MAG: hypothetical protein CSA33_04450 [Desulfobulbus propionicus]|nr:MAG: hypothetical protein CSA33_04450 [Desulfobulbus propionicus]